MKNGALISERDGTLWPATTAACNHGDKRAKKRAVFFELLRVHEIDMIATFVIF